MLAKAHQLDPAILDDQLSFNAYLPPSYNQTLERVYPVL